MTQTLEFLISHDCSLLRRRILKSLKLAHPSFLIIAVVCTGLTASGCRIKTESPKAGLELRKMQSPTGPGAISPHLTKHPDGSVLLSWLQTENDKLSSFQFAVLKDGIWSATGTVQGKRPFSQDRSQSPGIVVLPSGGMVAYWSQAPESMGAKPDEVNAYFSSSSDGGVNWTSPAILNQAGSGQENSYVSGAAADEAHVALIWLDGTQWDQKKKVRLLSRLVDLKGQMGPAETLDEDTCTCCPTSIVAQASTLVAAYRSHTNLEIRDIAEVRRVNGVWSTRKIVHDDNWEMKGCPVNGPALDALGGGLGIIWFTGAGDKSAVKVAFSTDHGVSFGTPLQIDESGAIGRSRIAMLTEKSALAFWVETGAEREKLLARLVAADGNLGESVMLGQASGFGYPTVARGKSSSFVAWQEEGPAKTVRLLELSTTTNPL